jgi:hypothetical protein
VLHEHAPSRMQDTYHGRLMVQRQPITQLPTCSSHREFLCLLGYRSGNCCCVLDPHAWFTTAFLLNTACERQLLYTSSYVRSAGIHLTFALVWKGFLHTQQNAQYSQQSTTLMLQIDYSPSKHLLLRQVAVIYAGKLRNCHSHNKSALIPSDMHATRRPA